MQYWNANFGDDWVVLCDKTMQAPFKCYKRINFVIKILQEIGVIMYMDRLKIICK